MSFFKRAFKKFSSHWIQSGDPLPLELFRRGLGLILILQSCFLAWGADQSMGERGWMSEATAQSRSVILSTLGSFGIHSVSLSLLIVLLTASGGLGMLLSRKPWLSTLMAWVGVQLLYLRSPLLLNGSDRTVRIFLFILLFFPWERKARWPSLWPMKLLRCQISLIYFSTFFHKLIYERTWIDGYALRLIMEWTQYRWTGFPDFIFNTALPEVATALALLIELSLGLILFFPKPVQWAILLGGVGLHLGISVFIVIPFFSPVMILSYLCFLDATEIRWVWGVIRKGFHRLILASVLICFIPGCTAPVSSARLFREIEIVAKLPQSENLRELVKKIPSGAAFNSLHQESALLAAAQAGVWENVRILLDHGYPVTVLAKDGNTLMHYAASQGQPKWIEFLKQRGLSLETHNHAGSTPLHLAVYVGSLPAAVRLLQLGADREARNLYQETPLHVAVWQGHAELVMHLLKMGALVGVQAQKGETPLQYAQMRKHPAVEKKLRAALKEVPPRAH